MQAFGIRLGRLFGIELRIDYSWFILFVLVGVTLTAGLLPALFPELALALTITLGVVTTILFFASVIIHELSHSLYAKSQGLEIRRITLFLFGGMSEIMEEPRTPRQEFIMAAAGPLASFALSLLFGFIWLIGAELGFVPLIAVSGILAVVNFLLAVFNLLPGLPLDGGRILRSIVWRATGSVEEGTKAAATGGKILSYLLIFWGVIQLVLFNLLGGIWLILIGLFLNRAVTVSYEQAISRLQLRNTLVKHFMNRRAAAIPAGTTVEVFLQEHVLQHKEQVLPVITVDRQLIGMVDTELLPQADPNKKIEQYAVKGDYSLHPDDPASKAFDQLTRSGLAVVPVTWKNGKLAGVLPMYRIKSYLIGIHKLHYIHERNNRRTDMAPAEPRRKQKRNSSANARSTK